MRWAEVVEVLDALERRRVRHWLAGGWGVDALVGAETQLHRDVDLAVDAEDFDACMAALSDLDFTVETDWLPLRVELVASADRWVDVHPVRFYVDGGGCRATWTEPGSSIRRRPSPLGGFVAVA